MIWPDRKQFAFTIFDDTDHATVAKVGPVYAFLTDLGFRITKSVWPMAGTSTAMCGGETCEDPEYLAWVQRLKTQGHEIGWHMATYHSSRRDLTREGLDRFAQLFGQTPTTMANHSGCVENMYWGSDRLTGINKLSYNLLTRFRFADKYRGHIEDDPHFWGDLCKARIKYARNFVFADINTLRACPVMPYHDPKRPYVKYWYASSEGPNVASFVQCISEANQDRLEAETGACIMYAHLADGFCENGKINPRFASLMERLSRKNGWFVPVANVLDYLLLQRGHHDITNAERSALEWRWLWHKAWVGRT